MQNYDDIRDILVKLQTAKYFADKFGHTAKVHCQSLALIPPK